MDRTQGSWLLTPAILVHMGPRHINPDWACLSLSALVKPGDWSFTSDLPGLWDCGLGLALQKLLPLSQQLLQSYNYHHLLNMTTEALCN